MGDGRQGSSAARHCVGGGVEVCGVVLCFVMACDGVEGPGGWGVAFVRPPARGPFGLGECDHLNDCRPTLVSPLWLPLRYRPTGGWVRRAVSQGEGGGQWEATPLHSWGLLRLCASALVWGFRSAPCCVYAGATQLRDCKGTKRGRRTRGGSRSAPRLGCPFWGHC